MIREAKVFLDAHSDVLASLLPIRWGSAGRRSTGRITRMALTMPAPPRWTEMRRIEWHKMAASVTWRKPMRRKVRVFTVASSRKIDVCTTCLFYGISTTVVISLHVHASYKVLLWSHGIGGTIIKKYFWVSSFYTIAIAYIFAAFWFYFTHLFIDFAQLTVFM